MITTTLRQIRQHNPCKEGWRTLLTFLGKTEADDEPLPLTAILQSNGLDDALWCLRTLEGHDKEIIRFVLACVQEVRHLMTDQRSLNALDAVARHLESPLSKQELDVVLAAAEAAAEAERAAAWAAWAARAAVGAAEAARAAARAAAEAARAAARAAAWAARAVAWTAAEAAWAAQAAAEAVAWAAWAVVGAAEATGAGTAARARQSQIFEEIFG